MTRVFACVLAMAFASPALGVETEAPTPEKELQRLLQEGNARAKADLEAGVHFLAFAYVKHRDGEVRVVDTPAMKGVGTSHERYKRVPSEALDELLKKLRDGQEGAGGYRAVAIFTDDEVRIEGKKTSAIQAGLEHESGYCVNVFTPYGRVMRELVFGKQVSSKRPEGEILEGCK